MVRKLAPGEIAKQVTALMFDTGGTVFDWYGGIAAAFGRVGATSGTSGDWPALTKQWRRRSTDWVNEGLPTDGGRATLNMDDVLRKTLDQVLKDNRVELPEAARVQLVRAWRELDAWPDVHSALPRLRERFVVTPFTILNTELVISASRRAKLSWDCIISCEMIGIYKTLPGSYATAARWLGEKHENILMVTTHNNDLRAAHENGFKTAFVYRRKEWAELPQPSPIPDPVADIVAEDFNDLANQLACK